jgi:hypothetical protein
VKQIKTLVLKIEQMNFLKEDLNVENLIFNNGHFINSEEDEKELKDVNESLVKKLKARFDVFIKDNPSWVKKYFHRVLQIKQIIIIIAFKLLKNNSNDLNKISEFDFKNYILNSYHLCFKLLKENQNNNFKEDLENAISNDGLLSYDYSKIINQRFIIGEKNIMKIKNEKFIFDYIKKFIGSRWEEYEDFLIEYNDDSGLYTYLQNFKIEDPKIDEFFSKNEDFSYSYYKTILKKPEDFFLSKPDLAFLYLTNNIFNADNLYKSKIKFKKFFDIIEQHPELSYLLITYYRSLFQENLEPYIYKSSYWSYRYAAYLVFFEYSKLEDLNEKLISSIKKYPKLYDRLLRINEMSNNDDYYTDVELDTLKPEDFGETVIVKYKLY